ncbi:hypothetical protein ACFQ0M_48545 [Kitasatospora aburaviensis]
MGEPEDAPLAELFDQWLEANPRPVTELERALGLQGTEMYLGYSGRFDGDYDIQAADGGLYVMRQPSLVHNRTRFSVRYVPDPDWPTNTDAVATVDTVEEVMAAVRRHVEKRAVLAPPAAEQEELFAVPAAALPSPPAAAPPTPAARVASDRPIGVTRIEVDGHQALIRLGRGGVREDRHGQYWVSCDCPAEGSARIVHRNAQEDDTSWCRTRGDAYKLLMWHAAGERGPAPADSPKPTTIDLTPVRSWTPLPGEDLRLGAPGSGTTSARLSSWTAGCTRPSTRAGPSTGSSWPT